MNPERASVGPAVYAIGYLGAAPWGFLAAGALCGIVLFVGALLLGAAAGEAATRAAIGAVVIGVPGGVMRFCYRRRLARVWGRLRRGELRP